MQRYAAGQSIGEISREEGKTHETVTKIVRSEVIQRFVNETQSGFMVWDVTPWMRLQRSAQEK
jgi:predicted transcriptional regulator